MSIKRIQTSGQLTLKSTLLARIAKNKRVVHIGCVDDNLEMIAHKKKNNFYLHDILTNTATECLGIDMNAALVEELRKIYGTDNIAIADIQQIKNIYMDGFSKDDLLVKLKTFDTVILPDIIEHLDNPGLMLENIKQYFNPKARIYICTPNPFFISNFVLTLFNREIYSPFHTMNFTTENMAVLLGRYGIRITATYPCYVPKLRALPIRIADWILLHFFCLISKGFSENFLYECVIDNTVNVSRIQK